MLSRISILLAGSALLATTATAAALYPTSAPLAIYKRQSLPDCVVTCLTNAIGPTGCTSSDFNCLCNSQLFIETAGNCYVATCDAADYQAGAAYGIDTCAQVGVTVTFTPSGAPTAGASVTDASVSSPSSDASTTPTPASESSTASSTSPPASSASSGPVVPASSSSAHSSSASAQPSSSVFSGAGQVGVGFASALGAALVALVGGALVI